ncbi:Replication protein A DNA-binding subunit C [Glycine max]|nr:Replication protein A DNA-binding subunit C [Glycine max]
MAERLTAIQNFGFLVKIPIAESLTPVQDFDVRLWFPVRDFRSSVVEELAGLCNFMARIPDKIRSIDGSKETLKLDVRITDLWFVGTPNKSEQAEMVFVDFEGDQIHAICKSDHLKSWKADLKENCTYVMHNFKVVKNDGQFRVCEHEYKLFFIGVTVVREADLHELPFKEFRFVEFANVVAGNFVSGLLVDIIGVVDQVVFRHVSSKNTRVVFRMKDLSGEILSCTLWENYCAQFLSYLNERGDDGPMVIILTHARIKDAQGSYPASVSNSFKASKLLINDPILEIQEFKERYRVEVMVTQNNESGKFLLWDRECAELIGQTADGVNRVKIEDGDLDLNASPQALDKLLGHVLAFKVRIQSRLKNVVVLKYSKDLDLINVVLEMLPDSEACSKIDPSNVDCNDATHAECQFLSATADHDPVAGLPLTPKKRMSSDEADDELGSSQISPALLSSNKLTRHSHRS